MKKLTQLHVDVSAYFFALALTVIFCLFVSAMCCVELSARETLLASDGVICRFIDTVTRFIDGYSA